MNIIIPYRKEPNDGLELRYALRSIQKYLSGYKEIYLIGDSFPKWLTNVKTIECPEESVKRPINILRKIAEGFNRIPDQRLLQWQDDIYLTQRVCADYIPYYAEGTLETAIKRHHGRYKRIIENTAMKLTDSVPYFDVHTPIIYERHLVSSLLKRYDWSQDYLVKTTYCHLANANPTAYRDQKLNESVNKDITAPFFSTSPLAVQDKMVEIWEGMYPEKSKYEGP